MTNPGNLKNPYIGPKPFQVKHKDLFFGRDKEAKLLFSRVIAERVVLFYAQSGTGKTSLINARLIPGLVEKKYQTPPVVRVGGDLPAQFSYDEVYNVYAFNTLLSLTGGKRNPKELTGLTLATLVKEKLLDIDYAKFHWIIFDQFEEIVTTHLAQRDKRADFFDQLRDLLEADKFLSLVLVVREDHLPGVEEYARYLPGRMSVRLRMEQLKKADAIDAVRLPAEPTPEKAGRHFPPEAAKVLIDDLSQLRLADQVEPVPGDYVEPLHLQIACYGLWEMLNEAARRGEDTARITQNHVKLYARADVVLENYYDDVIRRVAGQVSEVTEAEIRKWFGETLITPSGIRAQVNRGIFKSGPKSGALPNKVVDLLHQAHLLRIEEERGGKWYELSHDRFVAPILQSNNKWASSEGTSPLASAARNWIAAENDESFLYRGKRLQKAQDEYLSRMGELSEAEREFLAASIKTESQRGWWMKAMLVVLGIATLAAIVLAGFYISKSQAYEIKNREYEVERKQLREQQGITAQLLNKIAEPAQDTEGQLLEHAITQVPSSPAPTPQTSSVPTDVPQTPEFTTRSSVVGQVRWRPTPDGGVDYLDRWDSLNIVTVDVPQLRNVAGANNGRVSFNKDAADQFKAAWAEVEAQGLLDRVKVWNGSFARKHTKERLSSHALGLAFDINYEYNRSGFSPSYKAEGGAVRELVPIFEKYGFSWGGNWRIPEGAHFEVVSIVPPRR